MSEQDPPVSRWIVRKSDGTELRFPSLQALKGYILSGVITKGDVVAPEDASWARVEDLAELASLLGMIAPPSQGAKEVKRPVTRPNLNFGRELDTSNESSETQPSTEALLEEPAPDPGGPVTKPPPLPEDEVAALLDFEIAEEPKTVFSGPPAFDVDTTIEEPSLLSEEPAESDVAIDPLSRPINAEVALDESPLSRRLQTPDTLAPPPERSDQDLIDAPLSRPVTLHGGAPQTHEVMTLKLKRAQRQRIIIGSIVGGMLIAAAAFFAFRSLQTASTPPDQRVAAAEKVDAAPPVQDDKAQEASPTEGVKTAQANVESDPQTEDTPPAPGDAVKGQDDPKGQEADKEQGASKAQDDPKDRADKKAERTAKEGPKAKVASKRPDPANAAKGKSEEAGGSKELKLSDSIDTLMSRAKKVRKKKPADALKLYKAVLKKNPKHGDAMQLAARAHLQLGQPGKAIDLLKTCRAQRPRFSPCLYYLGRAYERAGKGAEARKAFKRLIDEFPESSLAIKARKKLDG